MESSSPTRQNPCTQLRCWLQVSNSRRPGSAKHCSKVIPVTLRARSHPAIEDLRAQSHNGASGGTWQCGMRTRSRASHGRTKVASRKVDKPGVWSCGSGTSHDTKSTLHRRSAMRVCHAAHVMETSSHRPVKLSPQIVTPFNSRGTQPRDLKTAPTKGLADPFQQCVKSQVRLLVREEVLKCMDGNSITAVTLLSKVADCSGT